MSDDLPFDGTDTKYPRVQYAFFTPENGQWVFRGDTVAEVEELLSEFLSSIDETEGPGILSTLLQIKAAGLVKEATSKAPAARSGGSNPTASSGEFPDWVYSEAKKTLGRDPNPGEIKTGVAKSGRNAGKPWYGLKDGDNMIWLNQPRG